VAIRSQCPVFCLPLKTRTLGHVDDDDDDDYTGVSCMCATHRVVVSIFIVKVKMQTDALQSSGLHWNWDWVLFDFWCCYYWKQNLSGPLFAVCALLSFGFKWFRIRICSKNFGSCNFCASLRFVEHSHRCLRLGSLYRLYLVSSPKGFPFNKRGNDQFSQKTNLVFCSFFSSIKMRWLKQIVAFWNRYRSSWNAFSFVFVINELSEKL